MILEATAAGDSDDRAVQHLHPSRHHSTSPVHGEYHLGAHGRVRASSSAHLPPNAQHARSTVVQPSSLPGQGTVVQHIFVEPLRGPPMKKSTLGSMGSNGSVMTTIGKFVLRVSATAC